MKFVYVFFIFFKLVPISFCTDSDRVGRISVSELEEDSVTAPSGPLIELGEHRLKELVSGGVLYHGTKNWQLHEKYGIKSLFWGDGGLADGLYTSLLKEQSQGYACGVTRESYLVDPVVITLRFTSTELDNLLGRVLERPLGLLSESFFEPLKHYDFLVNRQYFSRGDKEVVLKENILAKQELRFEIEHITCPPQTTCGEHDRLIKGRCLPPLTFYKIFDSVPADPESFCIGHGFQKGMLINLDKSPTKTKCVKAEKDSIGIDAYVLDSHFIHTMAAQYKGEICRIFRGVEPEGYYKDGQVTCWDAWKKAHEPLPDAASGAAAAHGKK